MAESLPLINSEVFPLVMMSDAGLSKACATDIINRYKNSMLIEISVFFVSFYTCSFSCKCDHESDLQTNHHICPQTCICPSCIVIVGASAFCESMHVLDTCNKTE